MISEVGQNLIFVLLVVDYFPFALYEFELMTFSLIGPSDFLRVAAYVSKIFSFLTNCLVKLMNELNY